MVMPVTTPEMKVRAVANRGAEVVLFGDTYDAAYAEALRDARSRLGEVYGFEAENLGGTNGTGGW